MPPVQPPLTSPRRLVFAGEAIVDITMGVPAFPAPGADVLAASSGVAVGGGFNVMAAAARQGLPVLYAGGHGTGPFGDLVRKALAAESIDVLRPPDPLRDTGFTVGLTVGLTGRDGERAYATRLGAESFRDPGAMDKIPVLPGDMVYISGYGLIPPASGPVLASWAASLPPGALLFCDPGTLIPQIPVSLLEQVLPRCDWLSCTSREAALLTGISASADAARALLSRTRNVIVRLGPAGCLLASRQAEPPALPAPPALPPPSAPPAPDECAIDPPITGSMCHSSASPTVTHVSAPSVTVVDTTGAGDAHAGVFLATLADGLPATAAARRANAAAALAVTRRGPATAPARAELDAFLS